MTFSSRGSNLVHGDTNGQTDVFVYDRETQRIQRASVDTGEVEGGGASGDPTISAGGRFVVFGSSATNLVKNDANGVRDVVIRDLANGVTRRVSVNSAKEEGDAGGNNAFLSASGKYVVFQSGSTNLVANDTTATTDIFLRGPLR